MWQRTKDNIIENFGNFKQKPIRLISFTVLIALICFFALSTGALSPNFALASTDFNENAHELRAEAVKLSEFSTTYADSSTARKANIIIASKKINGTIIHPSKQFSFNGTAGERTAENGYQTAKIIVDGKFVSGTGGGVCQVSTTLYNAVLLAGLKVDIVHRHSLPINYAPLSFDAMVSSRQDFAFTNNTDYLIYIVAKATDSKLTFQVFGEKPIHSRVIKLRSVTIQEIFGQYETEYDEGTLSEDESERIIVKAKSGYVSEGYLDTYQNGRLIKSELIRKDRYLPQTGKRIIRVDGTA
ncbi:MAG: VanW family protein [Firmicutes bacterium]|nr:VanW family protein [Bacillota bacterium]